MPPRRKHPPAFGTICCPFCLSMSTSVRWKEKQLDFAQRIVRHRICKACGRDFETRQEREYVTRKIRAIA
jgi:transcriptional regulator NrdR family protein